MLYSGGGAGASRPYASTVASRQAAPIASRQSASTGASRQAASTGESRQDASISTSIEPEPKTPAELIPEIEAKIRVKEAEMKVRSREAKNYLDQDDRKAAATSLRYVKRLEKEVTSLKTSRANLTRMQESLQSVTNAADKVTKLRTMVASQKSRKREGGKKMKRSRKQSITKRKTRKGAYIRSLLYTGGGKEEED